MAKLAKNPKWKRETRKEKRQKIRYKKAFLFPGEEVEIRYKGPNREMRRHPERYGLAKVIRDQWLKQQKTPPHKRKQQRRKRNAIAKQSRKANR